METKSRVMILADPLIDDKIAYKQIARAQDHFSPVLQEHLTVGKKGQKQVVVHRVHNAQSSAHKV